MQAQRERKRRKKGRRNKVKWERHTGKEGSKRPRKAY